MTGALWRWTSLGYHDGRSSVQSCHLWVFDDSAVANISQKSPEGHRHVKHGD